MYHLASHEKGKMHKTFLVQAVCLFAFLFPIFFQLSGMIFSEEGLNFNSQGNLKLVPLPLALIFCFVGIAVLMRAGKNHFGMGFIFSAFVLMMFSTIVLTAGHGEAELSKFILLIQFLLPMFGLVLGALYIEPEKDSLKFEAIALYILLIIIPSQVVVTTIKGTVILSPSLHIFSLYQHIQYLPLAFISLYFVAVVTLFRHSWFKYIILFLAPWIGVYIAASLSIMTILAAVVLGLISSAILLSKEEKIWTVCLIFLLCVSFLIYYPIVKNITTYAQKYDLSMDMSDSGGKRLSSSQNDQNKDELSSLTENYYQRLESVKSKYGGNEIYRMLPNNIKERFIYWDFYFEGVLENPKTFLFGHIDRPNRELYPSAHNYYLDLVYHFGFIALLPFFYLALSIIANSVKLIRQGKLTGKLFILLTVVLFFIFVDNFLKVTFRQPYPGMVAFFLWGILLSRLSIATQHSRVSQ